MIRTIQSGDVVEVSCFLVGNRAKARKGRKKGSTTSRKADQNARLAVRRLAQSINCNFGTGDFWITLKYDDARLDKLLGKIKADGADQTPDTVRAYAMEERDRFIRRVKRNVNDAGGELKFVASTSDIDGETGEYVKVHHHMVVNGAAFDYIFRHWPKELINFRPLDSRKDHTAVAVYILKQVRSQPDAKKYTVSRNLKKPVVVSEKIITVRDEIKPPRGAKIMHRDPYDESVLSQYVRYIAPPPQKKRGGKRE